MTLLHELRRRGGALRCRDDVRRRRPGTGGALRGHDARGALPPARAAARQARRRARRLVLRPARAEGAGRRRGAGRTRRSSRPTADALRDELPDGWLRDQVRGCATYAHVLAGDEISYSDEVEGCYGVRPASVSDDVYEAAHAELDELLPGDGSLLRAARGVARASPRPGRRSPCRCSTTCCRSCVRAPRRSCSSCPAGERRRRSSRSHDEPWWAFNYYQGDLQSRVVLNIDVPTTGLDLIHLAAHEVYPGHHTEHAVKEQLLIRDQGKIEEGIQLVPTPQAVLSEGIAETGGDVVLDDAAQGGRVRDHPRPRRRRSSTRSSRSASRRRRSRCAPSASTPR